MAKRKPTYKERLQEHEFEKLRLSKKIASRWLFIFYPVMIALVILMSYIKPDVSQHLHAVLTGPTEITMVIVASYFVHSGVENYLTKYVSRKETQEESENS